MTCECDLTNFIFDADSIGEETFEHLSRLFANGFSISDAYEKCKENVDFETVETCYVLLNK